MTKRYNKLTRADQFRLNCAVQQHAAAPGHKTFTAYADAAAFFAKSLGLEISAKNVENAVRTVGVTGLVVRRLNGDTLSPMWQAIKNCEDRVKTLEARVAELESLVKS